MQSLTSKDRKGEEEIDYCPVVASDAINISFKKDHFLLYIYLFDLIGKKCKFHKNTRAEECKATCLIRHEKGGCISRCIVWVRAVDRSLTLTNIVSLSNYLTIECCIAVLLFCLLV